MWLPLSRCRVSTGAPLGAARPGVGWLLAAFLTLALAWPAAAQTASRDMADIQGRLTALGYDAGAADGLLGPRTRAALRAFQADQGLPANGRPDGATLRALFAADPAAPGPAGAADAAGAAGDDPPSLDAVPLQPVQAAPLAPLEPLAPPAPLPPQARAGPHASPHEDLAPDLVGAVGSVSQGPAGKEPVAPAEGGEPPAPLESAAGRETRDGWVVWAAVGLAALGAVALLAALRLGSSGRRAAGKTKASAAPPRQAVAAAESSAEPSRGPSAAKPARAGRVFGVEVPPAGEGG